MSQYEQTLVASLYYKKDTPAHYPNYIALKVEEQWELKPFLPLIKDAPQLQELNLSFIDDMTGFNEVLKYVPNLLRLKIDGAELEHFPREIATLNYLERFSFEYCACPLDEVFDTLAELPHLMDLRFFSTYEDAEVHFLPPSFTHLKNLEEIDFCHWPKLAALPEEIGGFRKLHSLDLAAIDYVLGERPILSSLPESLCDLPLLEKLDVFGCEELTKFPQGFRKLKNLTYLDTLYSGIHELHLSNEQAARLRTLRMNRQDFEYSKCTSLETLAIGNELPTPLDLSGLAGLQSLRTLEVFHGRLLSTDFLTTLPNLRELRLMCKFDKLPDELEKTVHVETR